jgi:hypothetical protein
MSRIIANLLLAAGLLILGGLLWIEIGAAHEGCETARLHFGVHRCDDEYASFCWPVLGLLAVSGLASGYNLSGGRKAWLVWAAAAFLVFAAASAFGAFLLVAAAALGQSVLA